MRATSRLEFLRGSIHLANLHQLIDGRPMLFLGDPAKLAEWTEFHESVGDLPQDLREVFGLLHYHGVTQREAAALLGMSERTLKRKWWKAKLALAEAVRGYLIGDE